MSDSTTPQIPAGWYPDPAGGPRPRWWDGTAWTDHYADPVPTPAPAVPAAPAVQPIVPSPAAGGYDPANPAGSGVAPSYGAAPAYVSESELTAPPGTPTNTIWIWLVVFLPLLAYLPLFGIDWVGFARALSEDNPQASYDLGANMGVGAVVAGLLGLLVTVLSIVFSFLDYRALKNAGLPRPFHWGFSLLILIVGTSAVYTIGRAMIVKQRTGSGLGPLWATIAVLVLSIVISIVLMVVIVSALASATPGTLS